MRWFAFGLFVVIAGLFIVSTWFEGAIVEGVARSLDPRLNMWVPAEPFARDWVEAHMGVVGRIREAGESDGVLGRIIADAPGLIEQAEATASALSRMAQHGVRLDDQTVARLAEAQAKAERSAWNGR